MTPREQAKTLYEKGEKLKDIADSLSVNYNTIKQWKNRDKWTCKSVPKKRNLENKGYTKKPEKVTVTEDDGLTEKQRLFCEFYVRSFNATQAYINAYECSYNAAMVNACRLLSNDNVKKYVTELKEIKKRSLLVGQEDVVEKMMRIAFADIGDYVFFGQKPVQVMTAFGPLYSDKKKKVPVTKIVNYVDIKESINVDTSLISEISQGREGIKIKLADRIKALEWLSKYFNMNPMDQHKVTYDKAKLELDRLEYERKVKADESGAW